MPTIAGPPVPLTGLEHAASRKSKRKKIWVDLDNSPHVPFFRPIINELRKTCDIFVTARDAYQVRELVEYYGVAATMVGKHYGKHKILKAFGTLWRALALVSIVWREKPDLAICHGSRGLLVTSALFRIPSVVLMDYEFAKGIPGFKPTWLLVPSVVLGETVGEPNVIKYPGIKEDVYLSGFQADHTLRRRLGIAANHLLITVRPPATEAHYHNPEGEELLTEVLKRFVGEADTTILLLPRNKRQEEELRAVWAGAIAAGRIVIPAHVEDGLNLIWNSDLVISGGGTMNREAAAMGVPVYSIFRGKIGAIDHYLEQQGRLVLLETGEDVRTKINAVRREISSRKSEVSKSPTLEAILGIISSIANSSRVKAGRA
jgi:uncharacterized protein